jgi:signal transduction histidine kinase
MLSQLTLSFRRHIEDTYQLIIPMMLVGIVAYPTFHVFYTQVETTYIDTICTLCCILMLYLRLSHYKDREWVVYFWFSVFIILFPFNFTYSLLVNPNLSNQLGEMLMILVVFSIIRNYVLVLAIHLIGNLLAYTLYIFVKGTYVISLAMTDVLPWYLLAIVLGAILSNRTEARELKQNREKAVVNREKDSLSSLSRKDSVQEALLSVAHEINQPLSAMQNYTKGIKNRLMQQYSNISGADDIISAIDKACEQAQRAGDIIHTLKNFLCEKGTTFIAYNPNKIVKKVVDVLQDRIERNNITLKIKTPEKMANVLCEPNQIELTIINLMNNAIDAVSNNVSEKKRIIVSTRLVNNEQIVIEIEDSGPGIDSQMSDKLFTPFVSTKSQGLGLGLSLSQSIIESHQGKITVTSLPGEGATFKVYLPIIS